MSRDAAERRGGSGAKSCAECRRRKIRCVWLSNETCDPCMARGRTCVPQLSRSAALISPRVTAKQRISQLEKRISHLERAPGTQMPSSSLDHAHQYDSNADESDHRHEIDTAQLADINPPSHLSLLFDNFAVDAQPGNAYDEVNARSTRLLQIAMKMARTKLRSLLPSLEDVTQIAPYASEWMALYYTLFPPSFAFCTGNELIANYTHMLDDDVHPASLGTYLLSIAVTALQVPQARVPAGFHRNQGLTGFVNVVCRTVEDVIISDNNVSTNPQALETGMLFVRLSLGRGNLKGTWLTLRRIIALAELIGLPQASEAIARLSRITDEVSRGQEDQETLQLRANIWEAICATDRNFSMMLNFPAGTARYHFPRDKSVHGDGGVSLQAYNYQLSNICTTIFEIDESYALGTAPADSYQKVLNADRQLRALATAVPKTWWSNEQSRNDVPLAELLVKFWHNYFMARIHLRPGMLGQTDDQYAYSRSACLDACQNVVIRFPRFRRRVPSGFFVCRVLDIQAFTAATFLLLSNWSSQHQRHSQARSEVQPSTVTADSEVVDLVSSVVDCFKSVDNTPGSDLAQEATTALTSLISLMRGHHNPDQGGSEYTLQIPLLGKIRIRSRRSFEIATQQVPIDLRQEPPTTLDIEQFVGGLDPSNAPLDMSCGIGEAMPWSWSLEFDNTCLWMGDDLNMNDILGLDGSFFASY